MNFEYKTKILLLSYLILAFKLQLVTLNFSEKLASSRGLVVKAKDS